MGLVIKILVSSSILILECIAIKESMFLYPVDCHESNLW